MSFLILENNRFMKKALERRSQREICLSPLKEQKKDLGVKPEQELEDLNSPTTPNIQIPIFTPTKLILSITSFKYIVEK